MTAFDGVRLQTLGVNGEPSHEATIEVQLGQEVQVHITNELSEPTCLHWHGMKQLDTQEMDGMSGFSQCAIEPNSSAIYRYTPDKARTFWWHSHHGTQYAYGLRGPLIVHAPEPSHNLTDCNPHQPLSTFGFVPGRKYLLRLINVGAMVTFEFSIDGHEFQVMAADGAAVAPTKLLYSIVVNVGQRYDIIVQAKKDTRGVRSF
ncbi:hypothetical protein PF005_g29725 [Phytophthora fragariae]|uniref:Plastocyanin-like domain-containing protein n=1 Tax=Phytophthora fragariae TaxID=53985 RepID=A0A6A3DIV5_9STRA|nr:hypothetical protein PF003_g39621 [Phytophthora fragariae]KAE8919627.1 hypothetical protein PF009_g30070 [Phytophthora fragariae]KAE9063439.1 hypothetical protein PF007_g29554 [Phytophthora fragariae]KAE9082980.1 hypothetical protein PF006_g26783 [Phytophthora fragariae]KAE9165158.1 hypothetical protein PF005_g29725 [Phytophthora fragariae]